MTTYTVEIQASNQHGTIWQALEPAETVDTAAWGPDWTAEEVARTAADNQNVAEGEGWRVCVWEGADADTGVKPCAVYSPGAIADVERAGAARAKARAVYEKATEALRVAVLEALASDHTEVELARVGQVDRMTVRKWAGK